ncbi:Aminotran-1-2 domain-containing protein [Mycena indigotica]|uniref:Aminotran-1-2 domain-containing protein n=1 Tax=Mycena indigotica TaxID=2126181 RepID=A0A8H6SKX7_9AGAR|nr:Aminotran-1-2 domain-containing protein [Mycena indigotica]KAF7301640.1 Aminotran-1-2 domain-containing protein [Mycena indigotica]
MSSFKPDAVELRHHLSEVAKARATSPLKGLQKYLNKPGLLSLAGGLPAPDYFPFADVSANILVPNSFPSTTSGESNFSWIWKLFGAKEKTTAITIPKYARRPEDLNLATALQYGLSSGLPQLQKLVENFSKRVYDPAYNDCVTMLHAGNTDAWNKAVLTLCNPGEGVLVSKWTYPSAMASMTPYNIRPVPVDIDGQGMRSDALRTVLTEWDEDARGMPRPHVIYAVPIGENPTGTTTGLQRKKEIYQLCVEFDIILVEDDPYFVLQEGPYLPKEQRKPGSPQTDEEFIASLEPSYLKIDYQGRVIRLDTFSKTMAPGCRLGWYTCNAMFAERLERAAETSTQAPCGFSQSLVASTLIQWGEAGYMRWLKGLRVQYTLRRDFLVDCFANEFQLITTSGTDMWAGCQVFNGSVKPKSTTHFFNEKVPLSTPIFSFVPPTSGMFVWLKVHFTEHPAYSTLGVKELETKLFIEFAEAGLLIGPGAMFNPTNEWSNVTSGHYRVSFSNGENEELKKAVDIFGKVLRRFMEV